MGNLLKAHRDGDRLLQLLIFNEEFLVNASHQLALITSLPFVHTARRTYRLSFPVRYSDLGSWRLCLMFSREVSQILKLRGRWSRNKVAVGEPAAGSFLIRVFLKDTYPIPIHEQYSLCEIDFKNLIGSEEEAVREALDSVWDLSRCAFFPFEEPNHNLLNPKNINHVAWDNKLKRKFSLWLVKQLHNSLKLSAVDV